MNNKALLVFVFVFVFLVAGLFLLFENQLNKKWGKVCFKEYCFDVQLADNDIKRAKGLMFQRYLEQNKGMLFLFEKEDKHSFWMKNTLIPLDIIWMNKDKEVVFINENSQPCKWYSRCFSIKPKASAKYVLEVNSGTVQKIGLRLGDKLVMTY